ncbi:MAG: hypothetical protein JSV88_07060 [Candidatus Aminicenantes bacterium]|nr:MAG: hypothetical protein JSV88_07060 [Candidatus Aminicenantes bacterium]
MLNKKKIKDFFNQKYVKILLLVLVLAVSIKPFLFTWNFIQANLHLKKDKFKAGTYMVNALSYKSSVYKIFNLHSPWVIEHYLVKSAIYNNDKKRLDAYSHVISSSALQTRFNDNFYFQHLSGNIDQDKDWQHLDEVCFDLLTDPRMNQRTAAIFEEIGCSFNKGFIKNLADFVSWKDNTQLHHYLVSKYAINQSSFNSAELAGCDYQESIARVKELMWVKYKLKAEGMGANLVQCPGFTVQRCIEKNWYFSNMADNEPFSRGSFFMGTDKIGKNQNPVIRLMGFFVTHDPGKSRPRGGVRSRQRITAENGFYVFSFDYCTITGSERPSFFLCKGMEKRIPSTRRQWKKVIFILNNAFNTYEFLNPLIRMWGTGTLLVDNVFLAKVTTMKFSISNPYELLLEEWQPLMMSRASPGDP